MHFSSCMYVARIRVRAELKRNNIRTEATVCLLIKYFTFNLEKVGARSTTILKFTQMCPHASI